MTSDDENNKTAGINKQQMVSKITQLIAVLIRNTDQKKWQAYHFTALVEMLKKVDKNTLTDIWDQCFDDDHFRCVCGSIKTLHKNRNPIPLINLLVFLYN